MNFSATAPKTGIPLWYLVYTGEKTCTRRSLTSQSVKQIMKKLGTCKCGHEKANHREDGKCTIMTRTNRPRCDCLKLTPQDVFISICPGRGKAAICKNCGGWKVWHSLKEGKLIDYAWGGVFTTAHERYFSFSMENTDENHVVCSHYEPLKRRVISCEPEKEWNKKMEEYRDYFDAHIRIRASAGVPPDDRTEIDKLSRKIDIENLLNQEAERELGKGHIWQDLQDVLAKMPYPKGTEYARIELDGKT